MDFQTHKEAIIAKKILSNVLPEVWISEGIVVNWAVPEPEANGEKMGKVS